MCDVSNESMVWAAWLYDTQRFGRWRFEDEVKLEYKENLNKMAFTIVDTGKKLLVSL